MNGGLTLQQFADMTRKVGSDGSYLPTFVDPMKHEIRVLEGAPECADTAVIARNWAAGMDCDQYFLAYSEGEAIVAEEYDRGCLVATLLIQPN